MDGAYLPMPACDDVEVPPSLWDGPDVARLLSDYFDVCEIGAAVRLGEWSYRDWRDDTEARIFCAAAGIDWPPPADWFGGAG